MGNKKRLRPHTHRGMERRRRGNKQPRVKLVQADLGKEEKKVEEKKE